MRSLVSLGACTLLACAPQQTTPPAADIPAAAVVSASTAESAPPRELAPEQPIAQRGEATPLHVAAKAGDLAKLEELIASQSLAIGEPDENGLSPLHHACGKSVEAARLLIDAGAAVRTRSSNGTTPLYVAARMNKLDVALLLIERGAAIDERGPEKNTPLMQAVYRAELALVDLLLHHGADPRAVAVDGQTALHVAAQFNKADAVKRLIEAKADVNAVDAQGNTPLHRTATFLDAADAAGVLLLAGARRDATNVEGLTPQALAVKEGRQQVAALLAP